MRRLLLVVSMVVLAGCNRDLFKPGAKGIVEKVGVALGSLNLRMAE